MKKINASDSNHQKYMLKFNSKDIGAMFHIFFRVNNKDSKKEINRIASNKRRVSKKRRIAFASDWNKRHSWISTTTQNAAFLKNLTIIFP